MNEKKKKNKKKKGKTQFYLTLYYTLLHTTYSLDGEAFKHRHRPHSMESYRECTDAHLVSLSLFFSLALSLPPAPLLSDIGEQPTSETSMRQSNQVCTIVDYMCTCCDIMYNQPVCEFLYIINTLTTLHIYTTMYTSICCTETGERFNEYPTHARQRLFARNSTLDHRNCM